MAIKSEAFSRVELTDQDAARFLRHLVEDAPNPRAREAYLRGKAVLQHVLSGQKVATANRR